MSHPSAPSPSPPPPSDQLRVVSVSVKDVLGAREFAIEPGQITTLKGRNATGKSTALAAVQAAIGGGNLANLARIDPDGQPTMPEVVLVLDGPREHYRVERTGANLRVRARVGTTAAFEDVPKPQTFLSSLFDGRGANPVTFLTAADKDRARLLLEALPLTFDRAALFAEMGITPAEFREMGSVPEGLHPLEEIGLIREAVFRTRTGVNRDQRQQEASAEQLRRSIPAVLPEAPDAAIQALDEEIARLRTMATQEQLTADAARAERTAAAEQSIATVTLAERNRCTLLETQTRREAEARIAEWRLALERRIADENARVDAELAAARQEADARIADVTRVAQAEILDATAAHEVAMGRRDELALARAAKAEQLAGLRATAEEAVRVSALADQVVRFDAQAARLAEDSERLTRALDALDGYARRMAADLPIPGLSIEGRTIRVNGIPFEQLNTAQRVEIAVKVATLRAAHERLPIVWVDGAEALDSEHFGALTRALRDAGVQAFIARVSDDEDLVVEVMA